MSYSKRVVASAGEPWLLLTAAMGGGLAWAVGLGPVAFLVGGGMLGLGALVGGVLGDRERGEKSLPALVPRTAQSQLVATLTQYVKDLHTLRESSLPDSVMDPAIQGLVAAQGAQDSATRVALAVDGLDRALYQTSKVSQTQEVRQSAQRMAARRNGLLGRLQSTVDQTAEVYTRLLEMSATVSSMGVGEGGATELTDVNTSLESLRNIVSELEAEPA